MPGLAGHAHARHAAMGLVAAVVYACPNLTVVEVGRAAANTKATAAAHCAAPGLDHGPKNDRSLPIGNVRARNLSCQAARRAIRNGRITIHCCGSPGPAFARFKTPHFRCTARPLGHVHCTASRRRAFSFDWSE